MRLIAVTVFRACRYEIWKLRTIINNYFKHLEGEIL
jgi:hypothetical protein